MTLHDRVKKLEWFVTYGTDKYLDERGRVRDTKCWMTEKQAKYFDKKHAKSVPPAQAVHEERN